jgi:phenylacetate-CoA ligase
VGIAWNKFSFGARKPQPKLGRQLMLAHSQAATASPEHQLPEATLAPGDIRSVQERAWDETLRYVRDRSPFYREHFVRAGISPGQPVPLEALGRIPPIEKQTLSERTAEFLCVPEDRVVDIVTTSGSTGQPLVWKLTEADLERLATNELLSFDCAGLKNSDCVLLAVTLDRCFIAGMAYFLGLRKLGCAVARVGPSAPAMHLDLIRRLRPTAIVGVPSFLNLLAEKGREAGIDLRGAGIRKLVCIGEPVRDAALALNRAGKSLTEHWGAEVYSTYGITELAASACECSAGQGGHLHPELLYVECLGEDGKSTPDGEVGEITATTFGVEGMPLIRYRTGDYAAIFGARCKCGRSTPRLGPVVGRRSQKLKLRGTTVFPSTLQAVLDACPAVVSYVILADRDSLGSDTVEVRVACAEDSRTIFRELREHFQGKAKVVPQLLEATPEVIEAFQLPEGARKRRYFVDLRS